MTAKRWKFLLNTLGFKEKELFMNTHRDGYEVACSANRKRGTDEESNQIWSRSLESRGLIKKYQNSESLDVMKLTPDGEEFFNYLEKIGL